MAKWKVSYEEVKLQAENLVEKVKELIHEGNVRRIIIKDEKGNTFIEIPVTVAAVAAVAAPVLAAVGTIAALVAHFTIVVERTKQASAGEEKKKAPTADKVRAMEEDGQLRPSRPAFPLREIAGCLPTGPE